MDEFVFLRVGIRYGREAAKAVHHETSYAWAYPHIAIDYPDDVAFGFAVGATHIPDLGVWPKIVQFPFCEIGVIFFDEDADIEGGVVGKEARKGWIGWVIAAGDAEVDGELGGRVALVEGCGETFVEAWFEAFDGADDGYMRDVSEGEGGRNGLWRGV